MKLQVPEFAWRDADPVTEAGNIIRCAVRLYAPRKTWAMCSGGNDSLTSTYIAMESGLCDGVASIDTTIGIRQTRDHLTAVAARFGWPLRWLRPPQTFAAICARMGMPGPGAHPRAYQQLKERCVRQLIRESKRNPGDRIALITGTRLSESDRRMGNAAAIQREGVKVWIAPIVNWDDVQKMSYMVDHAIPLNPVKSVLGISGECLCGAFAKPGEREKIREYYPEAEALIVEAEMAAGANCKPDAWGTRPAKRQSLCQNCDRKNRDET